MITVIILISLAVGFCIGYAVCKSLVGRGFQKLYDDRQIVVRTEDGWQGSNDAMRSVIMAVRK
jgi:hypothetical protein